jgi:hypothetical protein
MGVAATGTPERWNNQGDICKLPFNAGWCGKALPVADNCILVADVVATVTVRTAGGSTYAVEVQEPQSDISLGAMWPPK